MYVSCPPLPSGGFQHDYDATKLGKIIQTAKFFFGKVLEGVQNYLRVLLSPPPPHTYKTPKGQWLQGRICKNLKKTCQNSISRSPEQGMYDTILTLKNRREIRSVFLPTILRRFFVVFVVVVYVIDIQCDTQIRVLPLCLCVVKNRADCLQNSLFWLVIKSILRSHLDYFADLH